MSPFVPTYRRVGSALHAAGAGVAICFCAALGLVSVLYDHPLVLGASLAAAVAAGAAAGVGAELRRGLVLTLPLALLVALVNPIVSREGETLLVRGWEVLGRRFDVTLEALAYGGVAGLRVLALGAAFSLFSAAVDPDEVLRLFRRLSYRSALTASLATRLIPLLARDAARMSDAARCRAEAPGRLEAARAALRGALERAVEVAAALEVRGYGAAGRPARTPRRWSRHDLRVAASAGGIAAAGIAGKAAGVGGFEPYPALHLALGTGEALLLTGLLALAVMPFAGAGARMGVAHA